MQGNNVDFSDTPTISKKPKKRGKLGKFVGVFLILMLSIFVFVILVEFVRYGNIRDNWIETVAVIEKTWIADVSVSEKSDDEGSVKEYTVTHGFVLSYETDSGFVSVESYCAKSGHFSGVDRISYPRSVVLSQRYVAPSRELLRQEYRISSEYYDFYAPGENVSILYNPQNPESAEEGFIFLHEITDFEDKTAYNLMGIIFCSVCVVVGVFLIIKPNLLTHVDKAVDKVRKHAGFS